MKRFYSFFILLVACLMTVSVRAAQSLPYSYGFEDNDLATDGWTTLNQSSQNASEFGIFAEAKHNGSYGFRFSSFTRDYTSYDQYLFSPELDAAKGVIVQFYYAASSTSGTEKIKVGYSTTDADLASFTWGNEISTNKTTWAQTEELSFPAGTKYVAIHYYSDYQYRLHVDDITFSAPAACPKPKNLAYSEVKNHSVQLAWAENGEATAWKIAYKKAADADYTIADADTNPFVLSGLDAETAYVAKVQADCGSEQSDFSNEVSFTTLVACPVPAFHADSIKNVMAHSADIYWGSDAENFKINYRTAAYVDGLEEHFDVSAIPSGWSRYTGLVDNVIAGTATLSSNTEWTTTTYGLGSYNAKLNIYGSSCKHWLLTPEFVFPTGGEFSFKIALTDYGNDNVIEDKTAQADDRFVVLVYADDKWTILREWNNNGSKYEFNSVPNDGETIDDIDLSEYEGKTIKIAFYGESTVGSNGDNDFHIDDVLVGIIYKAGDWNEKETSDKPFQLDGLDAETIYDIKVQALCGGIDGDSEESAIVQFTTISDCQTPDALVANNITASSAVLSWNGYGKSDFNLQYRVKGSEEPMTLKDGIQNNFLLEELLSNTVYEFQVQPTCAEAEAWSALFEFRTACGIYEAASWTDGFEDGIYCWTVGNLNAPTNTYYIPYVNSTSHEGTKALKIAAYRYSSTTNADSAYAVLPHFDYGVKGLAGHTLKFYARQESTGSTYNDHLLVGVVSDPADLSTFTQVADVQVSGTDYALYEVQLTNYTGSGEYLVLLAVTNPEITQYSRYASFYVDDIAIEETPACQPLASISISDVQRRSMVVTLHPKTGLDLGTYDLVYSKTELDNDALEAAEKKTVSAATDTIKGLDRETKYYVYVRANCDADGVSAWVSAEATTKALAYEDEVIAADGSESNSYLPINSSWTDTQGTQMQSIYSANMLTDLMGQTINSLHYYVKSGSNAGKWDNAEFEVRLMQTEETSLANDFVDVTGATLVYTGKVVASPETDMIITLDAPFTYTGKNLLVDIKVAQKDDYVAVYFYGITASGQVSRTRSSSYNFLPKVGFGYSVNLDPCPAVSDMAFELIDEGTTKANVSWTISDADYLSGFEYIRSTEPIDEFSEKTPEAVAENHIEFTDLEAGTHYYVYVRAICQAEGHDEGTSATWASVDFTTNADCPVVNNLQAELTGTNTVLVSWEPAYAEQDKKFLYAVTETELVNEPSADLVEDTTRIELALDNDKHYYIYVASKCGEAHSDYQMVEINTLPSCQAVENLAYTRLEHNLVEITWTSAEFAAETQWEVSVEGGSVPAQIVSERHALIYGLQPETAYAINVKAICSDTESSAIASLDITTAAQPGNCKQVGTGTSSNYYTPMCTYNKYSWVQMIYPASEIGKSGEIQSIAFQVDAIDSSKDLAGEVNIYMAHTAKASHSSTNDWIAADDLKLVYHTDAWKKPTATGWMEMALETTFDYNGTDNLVIVMAAKLPDWSMSQKFNYTSATNSVLFRGSDSSTDADAYSSHPGSYAGTQRDDRPNIQLCFPAKACPDVVNLAVSGIDKHEATVSWEPMGSEVAWNVLISDKLLTEFDGAERIETLSKHFDTLEDDQDYYVYVQPADCDGADFSMISFVTLPSCKVMTSPAVKSETIDKHEATVYWVDPNAEKAGQYQVAYGLFSDFDLNDEATYELTDVVTDTFAVIDGLAPETKYAFAVKANCDGDDPSRWSSVANFTTLIGCYKPNTPSVLDGSITTNSATVYWVDEHDAAGYIVAYGLSNTFDIEDPNTYEVLNVTDTFAILPNLLAASTYKVRVKSDCGAEDGQSKDWSYAREFTTACGTFDLPFSEDFEEAITCWTMVDCESSTGRNSEAKMEGSYGFKFRYNLLPPQYLISPELVASDKPIKVEFYHKKGGSFTETFKVGYSTTTKDVTAFTWAEEVTSPSRDEWTRYADVLPASVKYVAIQYTASDQLSLYIDNFSVVEAVPAVYNVTFAAEGAEGIVPAAQEVEEGQSIQMPVNKTLYVAGKTLTGWKAGEDTYAIGDDFTPAADVTLNAVFEDNTVDLLTADEAVIVKWIFGENAGAPSVHWEGNTGILVTQATIGEASIDMKLAIDATAGKFYNVGRADKWAQVNAGTIFAFPYKAGLTEEVDAYTNPASYTLGEGTLTVDANNYFSYLQITLPATPTALENTGIDTKAIKRLENGILVIELNGTKYNAQGMLIRK